MKHSTHPVEEEDVMAYLDGELGTERAEGVAAHLEGCLECRALAVELRDVSQRMAAWRVEPPSPRLAQGVTAALAGQSQPVRRPRDTGGDRMRLLGGLGRRLNPRWAWALAGAVAVSLVIVTGVPMTLRKPADSHAFRYQPPQPTPLPSAAIEQLKALGYVGSRDSAGVSGGPAGGVAPQQKSPGSPAQGPLIVRKATLTLLTSTFDNARADLERILHAQRGYVAQLATSAPSGTGRTLTATLRVPADRLDAALTEIKKLGRVLEESQTGEEVTQQYVDLVARLSNARNTEQRLIEVLRQRTGKVAEVLEVEQEIARVREEIEQMEAQRKSLEGQVRFASVRLALREDYKAPLDPTPPSAGTRLWNGLVEGYNTAVEGVMEVLLLILRYAPSVLFWSLIMSGPALFAWRRLRTTAR